MRWWRSRWVIVPGLLLLTVAGWNLHVAANATGEVRGRVVDGAGQPIPGATVRIFERAFVVNTETARTTTGADGAFRFSGNGSHAVQLQAEEGGARSDRVTLRLLFRAQDAELGRPLVVPR